VWGCSFFGGEERNVGIRIYRIRELTRIEKSLTEVAAREANAYREIGCPDDVVENYAEVGEGAFLNYQ